MINEMDDLGSQRPSSGVSAIVLLGSVGPNASIICLQQSPMV